MPSEPFVEIPIDTSPEELAADALEYLAARIPGWTPSPTNLETLFIEANSQIAAEVRDVAADVPAAVFRGWGEKIVGVVPAVATSATIGSTWTLADSLGHTIPAGTFVALSNADGDLITFETVDDVTVPAGSTTTAASGVLLVAVVEGESGNGLSGTPQLVDALTWVSSIAAVSTSSGGQDDEGDTAYLNRLASTLQLLSRRPILPRDFEILAKTVPGIGRAYSKDLYSPGPPPVTNAERSITVAVADATGEAVTSGKLAEVQALFEANREVNFQAFTINPTYTSIDVAFSFVVVRDFLPAEVELAAEAAVSGYLSPSGWGFPPQGVSEATWSEMLNVRQYELSTVINNAYGVNYITALTFGVTGGAQGTADVVLSGVAPLPRAGTITGSGSAP